MKRVPAHDPDDVGGTGSQELPRGVIDRVVMEAFGERLEDAGLSLRAPLAEPAEDPPVDGVLEEAARLLDVESLHQLRERVQAVAIRDEWKSQQLDESRQQRTLGNHTELAGIA